MVEWLLMVAYHGTEPSTHESNSNLTGFFHLVLFNSDKMEIWVMYIGLSKITCNWIYGTAKWKKCEVPVVWMDYNLKIIIAK